MWLKIIYIFFKSVDYYAIILSPTKHYDCTKYNKLNLSDDIYNVN